MIRDTLLIIDDSELDLAILNEIFKNLFRVECSSDARRGLTFLRHNQERVCAILLDICLERRGAGFTVLQQLQGDAATADLPVILITTDANEKDVRASVERGAVDFLVKPVNPHSIQERVCSVVRAAWPSNSTILDRKNKLNAQASSVSEPKREALSQRALSLEESRNLYKRWKKKLEAFSRLRPCLDTADRQSLETITTLLAQRYVKQFPEQGLTSEDAALIGMAAGFCDIGLLGIPDRIIEEGEEGPDAQIYCQHTKLGYDFFTGEDGIPLFQYAAEIALWHHKNIDGSGYPQTETGTDIPLSAQLTHTASRIQHYLNYYRGYTDGIERMLRALKSEVGITIALELYQAAELEHEALEAMWKSP